MAEVGQAYLQIIPSMKGMSSAISKQMSGAGDSAGRQIGSGIVSKVGSAFGTVAKVGVGAIASVGTALGGLAAAGGISRALNIEQATYKLQQMGIDVESAMESCNEAVQGTAFGLDAAATVASSLGASGVQAGDQMTRALQATAGMAAMSGRSMEDVGLIFGKVAAQGRLQGDELMQFAESGINATAALASYLGVTQAEARELVSQGVIDFQTFSDAMHAAFGEAAYGANATFSGAASNIMAALSRLGAKFADPALGALKDVFVALIPAVDAVSAALDPAVEAFSGLASAVSGRAVSGIEAFTSAVEAGHGPLGALSAAVTAAFDGTAVGKAVSAVNGFVGAVRAGVSPVELLKAYLGQLGDAASEALGGLAERFPAVASALSGLDFGKLGSAAAAVGSVAASFALLAPKIAPAATAVAGLVSKMGGLSGAASAIGGAFSLVATKANTFGSAVALCGGGVKGFSIALGGGLMSALGSLVSPVGLVVAGIAALAAGFAYMMSTNEGFRSSVMSVVQMLATSLAPVISNLVNQVSLFVQAVMPYIMQAMQAILPVLGQLALVVLQVAAALMPVISTVVGALLPILMQIAQVVVQVVSTVVSTVMPAVSQILGIFSSAMPAIQAAVTQAMNAINTVVGVVMPIIQGIISAVMAVIQGDWSGAWESIKSALSAAWEAIKSGVSAGIDGVLQFFSDLPGNILSTLGDLGSLLLGAGGDIVQGLINGINDAIGGVGDAIMSGVSGAVDSFKSFLGIASPSKLFEEFGGYTMEGLSIGVSSSAGIAERSMREAAGDVAASWRPAVAGGAQQASAASVGDSDELAAKLDRLHEDLEAIYSIIPALSGRDYDRRIRRAYATA